MTRVKVMVYSDNSHFYGLSIMRIKERARKAWLDAHGYPYTSYVDEFGDTVYTYTVPDTSKVTELNEIKANVHITPLEPMTFNSSYGVDGNTLDVDDAMKMWNDEHPTSEGGE